MLSSTAVNLTNCDREPIHVPGSVQGHGFLLVVAPEGRDLRIRRASENACEFLGLPFESVLGGRCSSVLGGELTQALQDDLATEKTSDVSRFLKSARIRSGSEMEIITHRTGAGQLVAEFERLDEHVDRDALNTTVVNVVTQMERLVSIPELGHLFTAEVRKLTRFDRVLLYSFDADGNGTVIAEDRNDRLPSMFDLRFPATDIPQQARRLYELNRVRIIPAVDYKPSSVVSMLEEAEPFDMTYCVLRSVSPVHRDYMRNMETAASMSISLVVDGKLWGMVSCHNASPKTVPYTVRSGCDVLTRIMASQISGYAHGAHYSQAIRLKAVERDLLTYMAVEENYLDGITHHPEKLIALTDAAGAALLLDDVCVLMGETPTEPQVKALGTWLANRQDKDFFVSDRLSQSYPPAEAFSAVASGVIAISLSQIHQFKILWFRPEIVKTVHWAGEPQDKQPLGGALEISPRRSFASWSERVRQRSRAWCEVEIEAARDFRNAVLMIVLRRAEELAQMAAELEFTNKELEAFSYSVSHDLRAPFRHISGFAELLMSDENERLSEKGKDYLRKISRAAQFAGQLVDSLLNFSQIARTKLDLRAVPMQKLVEEVWSDVVSEELNGRNMTFTCGELPEVQGDLQLLRQAWRNLLSNAAKYTRTREHAFIEVTAVRDHQQYVFSVKDNGVGFDRRYAHKLFGAFQRLHRMEEFEGTGIGLANVRRIISRHGGQTWAEGELNHGATFFFSLPIPQTSF